jgi:hypothetical protein
MPLPLQASATADADARSVSGNGEETEALTHGAAVQLRSVPGVPRSEELRAAAITTAGAMKATWMPLPLPASATADARSVSGNGDETEALTLGGVPRSEPLQAAAFMAAGARNAAGMPLPRPKSATLDADARSASGNSDATEALTLGAAMQLYSAPGVQPIKPRRTAAALTRKARCWRCTWWALPPGLNWQSSTPSTRSCRRCSCSRRTLA